MKLPFVKYLEALVMCRYDNEKIQEELHQMPIPLAKDFPEGAINNVREVLQEKDPEYLKPPFKSDYPDMDLIGTMGISDLVHYLLKIDAGIPLKHISGAFELLYDADMFEKISALALANVTEQDIELIVHGKYNIHYDESQIKAFLFYFFNVNEWTISDKKDYLKRIKDEDLAEYYKLALDGDKNYLMWKLDIAPQKSFEVMLQDLGSDAYYFFKEKAKYSPSEAQVWAGVFLRTVERAEKLQSDKSKDNDFFKDIGDLIARANKGEVVVDSVSSSSKEAPLPHIDTLNEVDK
jgi:hypothetical protein